jgi:hypothetical protein
MWAVLAPLVPFAFFAIAAVAASVASFSEWRVLRRLENAHPDIIRHFDESWGPTSKLLRRFIWRDTHERMGDPLLSKLIDRSCGAWIIAGLGLVLAVVTAWLTLSAPGA